VKTSPPANFDRYRLFFIKKGFAGNSIPGRAVSRWMTEAAMKRWSICFCVLLILDGSGYSQTANAVPAFYIVLNSLTKNCTVVDRKPHADTPNVTVASDAIYKTRAEAETAMRTLTPCNQ
jgi:hypothetical protein